MHYLIHNFDSANLDLIKLILEKNNLRINEKNKNNQCPVHLTANSEAIKLLSEHKANLNIRDHSGRTPLHYACSKNDADLVLFLIRKGAKINFKDNFGNTVLLNSFSDSLQPSLLPKIHTCGSVNYLLRKRITSHKLVESLLLAGANVNERNINGETALSLALSEGNEEAVKLLMEHGADLSIAASNIDLIKAAIRGNSINLVKWLLEKDLSLIEDSDEYTALHLAALTGNSEIIRLLIDKGADPNISSYKEYPVHIAASQGNSKALKELIVAGADIKKVDSLGRNALHLATRKLGEINSFLNGESNYTKCIELLLNAGINPNLKDSYGFTPLMYLERRKNELILDKDEYEYLYSLLLKNSNL
ncbi:MAG: ankyrin repeat domain-containing protein [Cytophagaceae bacterium]